MAALEYIQYIPHRPQIDTRALKWVPETSLRTVHRLPQVFWRDGEPWREVNLWALEMGRNRDVKIKSVHSLMEHLHKYADWLEGEKIDWRHFPQTKADRVLVRYRGALVDARDHGVLRPSTATARMNAVIRFYRYAAGRHFIGRDAPKWQDKLVVLRYFDTAGFERTMSRVTTDISIPNRARPGIRLEDGLLPLSEQHMMEMLRFAKSSASEELFLMLHIGCFTGARLGTITTLRVPALDNAVRDPKVPGMWIVPIGPGTGIVTKFDISGDLIIPDQIMTMLKAYSTSRRHLDRVIKAADANKSCLFLTRHNKPYTVAAVDREMVDLRRTGQASGLKFLQKFKFHQTRATYGTWLISICLEKASVKAAIEFVKRAMHHKNESAGAEALQRQAWAEFESLYLSLSPIQKAVLDAIARLSPHYEPYSAEAMAAYKAVLGEDPSTSSIQGAIKALQERELIWMASRGDYAFDDESLRQWYLQEHPEPPGCTKPARVRKTKAGS